MLQKNLSTELFWELLRKKSWGKSFLKMLLTQEICSSGHRKFIHGRHGGHGSSEFKRMLNGCFLVARAQEIFGGNLFKDVASQEIF